MKISKILLLALLGFSLAGCSSAQTNKRQADEKIRIENIPNQ
ncbi:MAG: hypothetical protein WKF71_11240 [Pyrinomonadaceae bacterium]